MTTPSREYRRVLHHRPKRLLKGADAMVNALVGTWARRNSAFRLLEADAKQVDARAAEFKDLSDHILHERILEYRATIRRGGRGATEAVLPALAAIRETADRKLGLRPFLVQLIGALALHRGFLAEMATGEGKTLTAGLAAVLSGWTNQPCHVVTVNDYLVQRDVEWLGALYSFCGVKAGLVTGQMPPDERRKGYDCDVTYATSKEILADFLRDRIHLGAVEHPTRRLIAGLMGHDRASAGLVMRGIHTAIIDEADSVLIDEAVTPLIISAQKENQALREVVKIGEQVAGDLSPETDYQVDVRYREVELTDLGRTKLERACAVLPGLWRGEERRTELVKQALGAREFYIRDKQYIVTDGKIIIVDEFTGRPMPQRAWRQGMHQAIEAKEGLNLSEPTETIARLSFQRYFRTYRKLSGMTGTAREAAAEFWQVYKLPVITIPNNRPCIRKQLSDKLFVDEAAKWAAITADIQALHATGRPILVGTRSVGASEDLAQRLSLLNLPFNLLNAVRHQEEATIIQQAGERGRITISTNMAGRGTDIKLGQGIANLGGLHVIATEKHESGRVDRQLFGRAARQGDPGSAQAYASTNDELLRRHLPAGVQKATRSYFSAGGPLAPNFAAMAVSFAQFKAQRLSFKQRKSTLRADEWLDESLSFAGPIGA